jgi:hypothetical protein
VSGRRGLPCRRFTVLDGLILVAGVAVGFALVRSRFAGYWDELEGTTFPARWMSIGLNASGLLLIVASSLILILRLRRPRPAIRRVARQPGAAACFAALVLAVGEAYIHLVFQIYRWNDLDGSVIDRLSLDSLNPRHDTSFAIASVWLIFALGRIGRPEAGWIDRAGRFAGWCWITWGVGGLFLGFYFV